MTEIVDIRTKELSRELTSPFEISLGTQTHISNVAVAVETSDGTVGLGEAAPVTTVTHETQGTVTAACDLAADLLDGTPITNYRGIHDTLEHHLETQHAARAGIEIAVFDALCTHLGCSLAEFAGGADAPVVTDDTIGIVAADEARADAREAVEAGFEHIKIKIGNDVDEDLDRVAAVREVAPDAEIKVDANQGYAAKDAIQFADASRDRGLDVALFEQPVPEDDLRGLKRVRDAVSIPVAADESVFTAADAAAVAAQDAADVINIKVQKAGIVDALDIVAIAEANDLDLMIGMMLETSLGVTAGAHLVSGTGAFSYVDLDGHFSIADPVSDWEYQPEHVVSGPGLGLDVAFGDL
jgi:L-alanine-DL-glutamate epimerase-like enolase superfamily enzyme